MPNPNAHKKKARREERRKLTETYTPEVLAAMEAHAEWEADERQRDKDRREARRLKGTYA